MSWLLISQIIASVCAFIWTLRLINRYLGVSDYAVFLDLLHLFTAILAVTVDLGINTHVIRHVTTDYDSSSKYLGNAMPLKSIFGV